jgi:hypothetical protein
MKSFNGALWAGKGMESVPLLVSAGNDGTAMFYYMIGIYKWMTLDDSYLCGVINVRCIATNRT